MFRESDRHPLCGSILGSRQVTQNKNRSYAKSAVKLCWRHKANLFNNLKKHHKVQYDQCMRAKKCVAKTKNTTSSQASNEASLLRASPYPSTSQRHSEITNAVAFHLAKDMCPINTVTNEGFKFLVNTLDKRYVIPSRNYFSKVALPAMYTKHRGEIRE